MALKLGELLLKAQLINQPQLDKALEEQKTTGGKLGEILQRLAFVTEDDIIECLSHQFGVPSINLRHFEIDPNVAKIIPVDLARKYNVIPVNKTGATLTLAMTDPTNIFAMDEITFMTGYRVEPVVASEEAIRERIDRNFGSSRELELKKVMEDLTTVDEAALELMEEEEEVDVSKLAEESQEAPVVRLVNIMLTDAIKRGASDIHVEPYEKSYRVRYRIDGLLREVMTPPQRLKDAITSRIKVLAKLDIAEKRLPQDGRIKLKAKIEGRMRELDFRVSVIPTLHGCEKKAAGLEEALALRLPGVLSIFACGSGPAVGILAQSEALAAVAAVRECFARHGVDSLAGRYRPTNAGARDWNAVRPDIMVPPLRGRSVPSFKFPYIPA